MIQPEADSETGKSCEPSEDASRDDGSRHAGRQMDVDSFV